MKKTTITFLMAGILSVAGLKAQSIQEGMNHLYADRFQSAVGVFEKLIAANPNNIEAVYWLGQTYFDMDNNTAARQLYEKTAQTNSNPPLILAGIGHADLLDNKPNDARAKFEAALTASRGRKGDDPAVLHAIGRANVDAKIGDFMYAIEKLELAVQKEPKNPEYYLQLGNAYRKARPGEGGGKAYQNYMKALEVDSKFAVADLRLSKLFESQKNWDLVLQYLNEAVSRDSRFAPAYYELFYYYFYRQNFNEAESQLQKFIANTDQDIQNDYLYAQLCYGKKDYDCAITKATAVINASGAKTKPRVNKLLAYAYFDKGDVTNAQKYLNEYFLKEKPDNIIAMDYKLKADVLSKVGASCQELFATYLAGAKLDTSLASRIEFLDNSVDYFKNKGCKEEQAEMQMIVYNMRPNPNPGSLINIGIAYSQAGNLIKGDSLMKAYAEAFPDSIYGHYWRARTNYSLDTTMMVEPYATNMVQNYERTLQVAETDKERFKSFGTSAAQFLAGYYNNIKADKETALAYTNRGLEFDSTHTTLRYIKSVLEKSSKQPNPRGNTKPGNSKPSPNTKPKASAIKKS